MEIEKELAEAHEWYKKLGAVDIHDSPMFLSSDFKTKFKADGEYANMQANALLKLIDETLTELDTHAKNKIAQLQSVQHEVDTFKKELDEKKKDIETLCLEYVAEFRKTQLQPRDEKIKKLENEKEELRNAFIQFKHKSAITNSNALITMHNNRPETLYYNLPIKDYFFQYISFIPGFYVYDEDETFWKNTLATGVSNATTMEQFIVFIVSTWIQKHSPSTTSYVHIIEYIKNHLQDLCLDIDSPTRTGQAWETLRISQTFENPTISAEIDKIYGVDQVYFYVNTIEGVDLNIAVPLEDFTSDAMAVDVNKMDLKTFLKCPRRFRIFDTTKKYHPFLDLIDSVNI